MRDLIVDCLATYRLVRLFTGTDRITSDLNEKVKQALTEAGHHEAAYFITCPWCSSAYCAILVVWARRRFPQAWPILAETLALSASTGMLAEHF